MSPVFFHIAHHTPFLTPLSELQVSVKIQFSVSPPYYPGVFHILNSHHLNLHYTGEVPTISQVGSRQVDHHRIFTKSAYWAYSVIELLCQFVCLSVCLSVCDVAKHPLPEVVQTSSRIASSYYCHAMTTFFLSHRFDDFGKTFFCRQ